jgi:hypothetical protein
MRHLDRSNCAPQESFSGTFISAAHFNYSYREWKGGGIGYERRA